MHRQRSRVSRSSHLNRNGLRTPQGLLSPGSLCASTQPLKQPAALPKVKHRTGTLGSWHPVVYHSVWTGTTSPTSLFNAQTCDLGTEATAEAARRRRRSPAPSVVFSAPSGAWPVGLSVPFCPLDCSPVSLALLDRSPVGFLGNQCRVLNFHPLLGF